MTGRRARAGVPARAGRGTPPRAPLALAAAAVGLPVAYRAAVRTLLRRNVRAVNAGNVDPLVATYADDVHFVFPGQSSWTADLHGREAVRAWVQRFADVGLQLEPEEILVAGPPWNTRVCLRFTDRFTAPDGALVYENAGVIFGHVRWGKMAWYTVHEDTQKVAAFDAWLEAHPAA